MHHTFRKYTPFLVPAVVQWADAVNTETSIVGCMIGMCIIDIPKLIAGSFSRVEVKGQIPDGFYSYVVHIILHASIFSRMRVFPICSPLGLACFLLAHVRLYNLSGSE